MEIMLFHEILQPGLAAGKVQQSHSGEILLCVWHHRNIRDKSGDILYFVSGSKSNSKSNQ